MKKFNKKVCVHVSVHVMNLKISLTSKTSFSNGNGERNVTIAWRRQCPIPKQPQPTIYSELNRDSLHIIVFSVPCAALGERLVGFASGGSFWPCKVGLALTERNLGIGYADRTGWVRQNVGLMAVRQTRCILDS